MARLLLVAGLVLTAGCGYSTTRLQDFPRARTIAVLPFENLTFRRDVGLRLTQAVVTEIRATSPFALGAPESADLVLAGRMTAGEQLVIQDEDRTAIQKRVDGQVEVTITERATGRVVRQATVTASEEYRPGIYGESLEGSAYDEWTRRIAARIVQLLERGF